MALIMCGTDCSTVTGSEHVSTTSAGSSVLETEADALDLFVTSGVQEALVFERLRKSRISIPTASEGFAGSYINGSAGSGSSGGQEVSSFLFTCCQPCAVDCSWESCGRISLSRPKRAKETHLVCPGLPPS